jgi:aspartyl-tRNA(Asn)/glutamyl-tRNA(Gln) amidotransferase subunit C
MDFTDSELRHLERLARVKLHGASRERLREQLARIIDFVRQLQEVDTSRYERIVPVDDRGSNLREDVAQSCLSVDEVLAEAPESERGMFKVPPVIDTGNS